MTSVVGNSDFKYEKSRLAVSLCWKFNGKYFSEYRDFIRRLKTPIVSTKQIRFKSGFLNDTSHYAICYIVLQDDSKTFTMYVKIYLEEVKPPYGYTNCEVAPPRVSWRPNNTAYNCVSLPLKRLSEQMKTELMRKRIFKGEDFQNGPGFKSFWFYFDSATTFCSTHHLNHEIHLNTYYGLSINLFFLFDYCSWNEKDHWIEIDTQANTADKKANESAVLTKSLFLSPRFSDFIIECGSKIFHTHRLILADKSVVFAAMLEQPMKEIKEGRVVIDDFEEDVVEEFLRFIYTGSVNVHRYAVDLFKISHRYDVHDLKKICETALVAQVNEFNLIDLNALGKLYDSVKLMVQCYSVFKLKRSILVRNTEDLVKFSEFVLKDLTDFSAIDATHRASDEFSTNVLVDTILVD